MVTYAGRVQPPVALTIAGSDSGAGAGLQADLKTFAACGVFAATVVTAVTAQNTSAVLGVHSVEPSFVDLQLQAVLDDLPVRAVKTGMLASSATVDAVARWAAAGRLANLVVDPVLTASTGRPLLDDEAGRAYLERLLPHALMVTPNIGEASLLTGLAITDVPSMERAARALAESGVGVVVVKGGHLPGAGAPDVVVFEGRSSVLEAPRVDTRNDHGTGCTLSAAAAAGLARGLDPLEALCEAKRFVTEALRGAARWRLGVGRGPLDHMGWSTRVVG